MEDFISKGYLYTLWGDQLTVKEGDVTRNRWCSSREAIFTYGKGDGCWTSCSPEPGKLVKGKLWLAERNDAEARRLLIDYHETSIRILYERIASHEAKIRILSDA